MAVSTTCPLNTAQAGEPNNFFRAHEDTFIAVTIVTDMERKQSQRLANDFAKGLKGFRNEATYEGVLDGEHVYYIDRERHGGHIGLPPYFAVSDDGDVYQLVPPKVFRASAMRHRLVNS